MHKDSEFILYRQIDVPSHNEAYIGILKGNNKGGLSIEGFTLDQKHTPFDLPQEVLEIENKSNAQIGMEGLNKFKGFVIFTPVMFKDTSITYSEMVIYSQDKKGKFKAIYLEKKN